MECLWILKVRLWSLMEVISGVGDFKWLQYFKEMVTFRNDIHIFFVPVIFLMYDININGAFLPMGAIFRGRFLTRSLWNYKINGWWNVKMNINFLKNLIYQYCFLLLQLFLIECIECDLKTNNKRNFTKRNVHL